MSKQLYFEQFSLAYVYSLNVKTVLLQAIQFSISTQFSSIWPIKSGPLRDGNEWVLRIPQSSSITGTSPSDCLVSYPGHLLEWGSYPTAVGVFNGPDRLGKRRQRVHSSSSSRPVSFFFFFFFLCFCGSGLVDFSWARSETKVNRYWLTYFCVCIQIQSSRNQFGAKGTCVLPIVSSK